MIKAGIKKLSVLFSMIALVVSTSAASENNITLYTSPNGIFSYSTEGREFEHDATRISGMSVQFVKDLFTEAQVEFDLKLRQMPVGLRRLEEKPNVGFFAISKEDVEQENYIWIGPIARDHWSLFSLRNSLITLNTPEDAKQFTVGAQKDAAVSNYLKTLGISASVELEDRVNPYRMHYKLIDLWATSRSSAYKLAFEAGYPEIIELQELKTVELYLALNTQVDPSIIDRLTKTYDAMIIKGRKWY